MTDPGVSTHTHTRTCSSVALVAVLCTVNMSFLAACSMAYVRTFDC